MYSGSTKLIFLTTMASIFLLLMSLSLFDVASAQIPGFEDLPCTTITDATELADCLANQIDCANTTDVDELARCANNTIGNVANTITSLPQCVNETLVALGECAVENLETCNETCKDVTFDADTLGVSTPTCNGIQSGVIDPLCTPISCCPACVDVFEEVAECLVNEVLSLTLLTCDFECPAVSTRRKLQIAGVDVTGETLLTCGDDLIDERRTFETFTEAIGCGSKRYLNIFQISRQDESLEPSASPTDSGTLKLNGGFLVSVTATMASLFCLRF